MALVLSFSSVERNDNKLLTITDDVGMYDAVTNPTGWGAPNLSVVDIDNLSHTLELDIVLTISSGVSTTFDSIDLYTLFAPVGGFLTVADLVFPLDCSMLQEGGSALGTSSDEFPDGLYKITYIVDRGLITEEASIVTILLDGVVANELYSLLRTLPVDYGLKECNTKRILDIIFMKTYLDSIHASVYSARTTSILDQLKVLERLLENVSTYTW